MPGDELHDPGLVEQQDRGAIAAERGLDGIQRRRVDRLRRGGAVQPFAELVERVALPIGGRQFAERRAEVFGGRR
jgi:hypothetical protein